MQTSTIEVPPPRKPRLEQETLALLEGKKEKAKDKPSSDERRFSQQGTVPGEVGDIDWDAPPNYQQSFGNDQRNVSTTVEGMQTVDSLQPVGADSIPFRQCPD
jgi:hypothetical protein